MRVRERSGMRNLIGAFFLGYADNSKTYRVWDCEDSRLVTTRTVKLDERPPASYRDVIFLHGDNTHSSTMIVWMSDYDDVPLDTPPSSALPPSDMEVDEVDEQPKRIEMDGPENSGSSEVISLAGGRVDAQPT